MALTYAGDGSIDGDWFNAVVDAVKALQDDGGGSHPWIGPTKVNAFQGQTILTGGGDVDGGTFTLTLDGHTTSAIAWNAGTSALISAIEALPNVGTGNVAMQYGVTWTDVNSDAFVQFVGLTATELMTVDTSDLTGPSAPYEGYTVAGSGVWLVELFTPAAGDILEDLLVVVPTGFSDNPPKLSWTDNPDDPTGAPPSWYAPRGMPNGLQIVASQTDYTNFYGYSATEADDAISAASGQVAQSIANVISNLGDADPPSWNLPTVVKNSVPIYAYLQDVSSAPTEGEIWLYHKSSTPGTA